MRVARARRSTSNWICELCRSCRKAQCTPPTRLAQVRHSSTAPQRGKLPDSPARTRFAPSPTGDLHLGSIRTAAFNYLLARRTNGQFLLRLEDTDRKRTVPGAEERLYNDLKWAGLFWDEGPTVGGQYGPYRQSERLPLYRGHIDQLLQSGNAYRCFCSAERLDDLNRRRHEKGLNLGYDRKCADIDLAEANQRAHDGQPHVIRMRAPAEWPKYTDLVYGKAGHGTGKAKKLLIDEPVWEDAILTKADGYPTYHWANVCDDHDMKITHVVRGSEWMSSTPLHMALYQVMGWSAPMYAHVPLLVDINGQKLSKRNHDISISHYQRAGIFPEALINFAALLGWSHQQKNDVMDMKDLEKMFDLKITKGNTIVSFDKLRFLQNQHAKLRIKAGGEELEQMIRDVAVAILDKFGAARVAKFIGKRNLRNVVASMLQVESFHYWSSAEFAEDVEIFMQESLVRPPLSSVPASAHQLRIAAATLTLAPEDMWSEQNHRGNLALLEQGDGLDNKHWKKELYHHLRWALLGGAPGPSIPKVMEVLGRQICVERIQSAALELKNAETMASKPTIQPLAPEVSTSSFADVRQRAAGQS